MTARLDERERLAKDKADRTDASLKTLREMLTITSTLYLVCRGIGGPDTWTLDVYCLPSGAARLMWIGPHVAQVTDLPFKTTATGEGVRFGGTPFDLARVLTNKLWPEQSKADAGLRIQLL